MRAVLIDQFGGPEVLHYTSVPDPSPGPGEVLVAVHAAGVNRADLLQRQGHYPPPPGAPAWPGLEVSGVISKVGADVRGWHVGERVAALLDGGGYADQAIVPASRLLRVPDGVGLVESAGLPEAVCTVWSNLVDMAHLQPGEWVLVHGGSGGVGTVAIQMAAALGARVAVTARTQDRVDRCLALGAEVGFVYRTASGADFAEALPALVQEATGGHGADVILDVVGGAYLDANLRSLAVGGRLVVIAMQRGRRAELDLGRLMTLRASVIGTTLRARPAQEKAHIVEAVRAKAWPMLEDGRLKPVIDSVVAMSRAGAAHELLDSGTVFGKVLLIP